MIGGQWADMTNVCVHAQCWSQCSPRFQQNRERSAEKGEMGYFAQIYFILGKICYKDTLAVCWASSECRGSGQQVDLHSSLLLHRCLLDSLFSNTGVCWDPSLLAGDCAWTVYLCWWTWCLETCTYV